MVRAPVDYSGKFSVNVSAVTTDVKTNDITRNTSTVDLKFVAVADYPLLSLNASFVEFDEDTVVEVVIAKLSSDDADGSEFLNVTVEAMHTEHNVTMFTHLIHDGVRYPAVRKQDRAEFVLNGPFDDYDESFSVYLVPTQFLATTVNVSVIATATDSSGTATTHCLS